MAGQVFHAERSESSSVEELVKASAHEVPGGPNPISNR